jgi:hypothetical protein
MAVLDTTAEISLMSEVIVRGVIGKGLRAPQLPVANRTLVRLLDMEQRK